MQRGEIEAKVRALLDAYSASGAARTQPEHRAADEAGRAALAEIAVDTLSALHGINEHLGRIAIALERQAGYSPGSLFAPKP